MRHIPSLADNCSIWILDGAQSYIEVNSILYDPDLHDDDTLEITLANPAASGIALQAFATAPSSAGDASGAGGIVSAEASAGSSGSSPAQSQPSTTSEAEVLERAYSKTSPINKYLHLALSDFDESFALLPQDANILDPRLMGPNFMNERVRLRMPGGVGGGGNGGGGVGEGGRDLLEEVLAMAMQAVDREAAGRGRGRAVAPLGALPRGRRRNAGGNLNPEAPLAQLFWQTLLPWNVFPTPSRPPPPPPRWL